MGPLDWLFGSVLDYLAERMLDGDGDSNDNLSNFDPRDLESAHMASYLNGSIVYTSNESASWYVDQGSDGTIDAHVVRDGMGYYWADIGEGYVNVGQDPSGS